MNFAFLAHTVFGPTVRTLARWFTPHSAPQTPAVQPTVRATHPASASNSIAHTPIPSLANQQNATKIRPLRVVRVLDTGDSRAHVGRMVISGRMADVCAELDRLVAREAALAG